MTRFCGDAIGVRSKGASAYTKKDLRKNMEKFIQVQVASTLQSGHADTQARAGKRASLPQ